MSKTVDGHRIKKQHNSNKVTNTKFQQYKAR